MRKCLHPYVSICACFWLNLVSLPASLVMPCVPLSDDPELHYTKVSSHHAQITLELPGLPLFVACFHPPLLISCASSHHLPRVCPTPLRLFQMYISVLHSEGLPSTFCAALRTNFVLYLAPRLACVARHDFIACELHSTSF